ncbi:Myb-binding protein 1A [Sparganum proliferum]
MVLSRTRGLISEAQYGTFVQIEGQEPSAGPFVQSTKIFLEIGLIGSILDDFPDFYAIRKHGTITVQPIYTIIDEQEKEGRSEHRALWDSTLYEFLCKNKAEQLEYALERLVKGLRSPTLSAREGFSTALVALIQKDETYSTKELLKLVDKHIYSFKAADQKEGAALNAAKLLVPKILLDAGRFDKLSRSEHERVLSQLDPLLKVKACAPRIHLLLPGLISSAGQNVSLYKDLVETVWNSARVAEEPSGEQILFMLRIQADPKIFTLFPKLRRFEFAEKSAVKRLHSAIKGSSEDVASDILALMAHTPNFNRLWTKTAAPLSKAEAPLSQKMQALKVACAIAPELSPEQLEFVFSRELVQFLRKQLSNQVLATHAEACAAVTRLVQSLHSDNHAADCHDVVDTNNDCRFPDPTKVTRETSNAGVLFAIFCKHCPLFDGTAAAKAPRIMSALLDAGAGVITNEELFSWAQVLQKLFLTGSEATPDVAASVTENPMVVSLPTEKLRLVVLDDLRQVTVCLLSRCSISSSDARDSVQTFATEALDFFLMASLSAGPLNPLSVSPDCVAAVTERVANFAGVQLAKCISLLCRRVSLRAELKATPGRGSSSHILEAMSVLLFTLIHLVKTAIRLCGDTQPSDDDVAPIVSRLKTARRLLRLAEESKSADSSAQWIAILDAITVLYLLTLHSSPPSPKETALLTVVDDISECHKRRSASAAGEEAMETEEAGTVPPEWSSVLTDAMLTLSVEPWRLLRETIAATFSRLVANSELLVTPLNTAVDSPLFGRLGEKSKDAAAASADTGKADTEDAATPTPLGLILSIMDPRSKGAQSRLLDPTHDEGDDDDDDDEEDGGEDDSEEEGEDECDGQHEADKDNDEGGDGDDDEKDSEDDHEDEDIHFPIEEEGEEDEGLTDAQMMQQDEALAAAFRAARAPKLEAKSRKETLSLLKLRSFDFLESFILYSRDANLFLPALHAVLHFAVVSANRHFRSTGGQAPTATTALPKSDLVSAPRIYSCLKELKNRPAEMNEALAASLVSAGGDKVLPAFLRAMFNTCKNCASDKHLIDCLVLVCEFLEFKKTSTSQSAIVEATLKDILSEFLTRTRPSRTHRLILLRLLSSSPSYAKVAQEVLLDRMDDVLLSSEAHMTTVNAETTSTKGVFMQTTFLQVATAITTGLAKAQSSTDLAHSWISKLLKGIVKHFYSTPTPCAWTKSQKLSQAVFTSVFECIKADQSALDDLTEQELHALLSFERTSVHKSVRPLHSRVLQLVHSMKGQNR